MVKDNKNDNTNINNKNKDDDVTIEFVTTAEGTSNSSAEDLKGEENDGYFGDNNDYANNTKTTSKLSKNKKNFMQVSPVYNNNDNKMSSTKMFVLKPF